METKPKHILKPERNFDYYFCVLIGIGALVASSYFVYVNAFEKAYPQLLEILAFSCLWLIGFYCLYYYLNRKTVTIFEDYIELKSGFFLRIDKIRLDDIQSWAELDKTSKSRKWQELYIFTSSGKYCFASYNYYEYDFLKAAITKNKSHNKDYEKKWDLQSIKKFSFFFLIFGIIFSVLGVTNFARIHWNTPYASDVPKKFVKINQIVTSEIKIKREGRHSRYVRLKLKDYPEFNFNIKGSSYRAMLSNDFTSEVYPWDTLTIGITKEDFEKKIAKTVPMDFWDKSINYYDIAVVSLAHRNKVYLAPTDVAKERKSGRESNAWSFSVFGVLLLGIGLFIFIKREEIANV